MSENKNTVCGCPCNNKNTRTITLVVDGREFDAYIVAAPKLYSGSGFVLGGKRECHAGAEPIITDEELLYITRDNYDNAPFKHDRVKQLSRLLRMFRVRGVGGVIRELRRSGRTHRELVHSLRLSFIEAKRKSAPILAALSDGDIERLDCVSSQFECVAVSDLNDAHRHNTSPVVAESEAVTSDAPAMTVQENTSAGAVSPSVPARPRFAGIGASVYDRERDRFFVTLNATDASQRVAELNDQPKIADSCKWGDAK